MQGYTGFSRIERPQKGGAVASLDGESQKSDVPATAAVISPSRFQ
jgi:hypothetical protein